MKATGGIKSVVLVKRNSCEIKRNSSEIKMSFGAESYLDDIRCRKIRSSMTSLRVSAHKLEVESGRYCKPSVPRNMTYCSLCLSKGKYVVGDEYHMVIECEHFNAPREAMYSKVMEFCNNFNSMNGYQKFIYILTLDGPAFIPVGQFIHNALNVIRVKPSSTATELVAITT